MKTFPTLLSAPSINREAKARICWYLALSRRPELSMTIKASAGFVQVTGEVFGRFSWKNMVF